MNHIFISYSSRNSQYAHKLAHKLRDEGFDVWIDNDRLRQSEDWWHSIVLAIRACSALAVILTPESDNSRWVQREITLAEKYNKPIFPIWLSGSIDTPNWELFVRTQYEDVRGERLPSKRFYEDISRHLPRRTQRGVDLTDTAEIHRVDQSDDAILIEEIRNPPPLESQSTVLPSASAGEKPAAQPPIIHDNRPKRRSQRSFLASLTSNSRFWLFVVLGLLAVSAAIPIVSFLILNLPPRTIAEPAITSFNINKTELAQGEILEINWTATDVTTVQLSVNNTVVATTDDPQKVSFSVDTSSLSGLVTLLLEGFNGDLVDNHRAEITIYEPMRIELFDVYPPQMVRYVVQGLSLSWDVPGATRTHVSGLETFNTVPLTVDDAAAEFTDLPVIPTDPLMIMLTAEDLYGNVLQQSLTINTVNPACAPAGAPVSLYVGPDRLHSIVGTVPLNTPVVVDARDRTGGWLRVIGLSGSISGWGQLSEFSCLDIFNPRDLRVETNVPDPPIVTPTSSP